jgi:hypothetical protein
MTRLFEIGLSNALAAGVLSAIVFVVVWKWRNEKVAYLLWLAVLVRFVAPPIFDIPLSLPMFTAQSVTNLDSLPAPIAPCSSGRSQSQCGEGKTADHFHREYFAVASSA